ncbi:MAG: hypothetical protein QXP36_11655 [Conexivisphaerales archaeon]
MEYTLTRDDLKNCIEFAINIYLKGGGPSRITGQGRGLGTIMNDWVGGKAVEIGVKRILEQLNTSKELVLDFSIYPKGRVAEDPDVIRVKERGVERPPRLWLEIKSHGENDRWIGLTEEQFSTINRRFGTVIEGVNKVDLSKVYLIYANLYDEVEDPGKRLDLLGAFLQIATKDEYAKLFEKFVSLGDIKIKIYCVLTLQDLIEKGVNFVPGEDYVYETDIFREARQNIENLEEIELQGGILPKLKYKGYPYPAKIGDLRVTGSAHMYKKQNAKSVTYFIRGSTDLVVENAVLGRYKLSKDKTYKFEFGPAGRNAELFRRVHWISARRAKELFGSDERMAEISQKI